MLNVAYNVVLPVFLIAGVSALIHNRLKLDVRSLSSLIIYVCSPALVLDSIANTDLNPGQIGEIGVIVFLVASIVALLALGTSRLMKWDRKLESAFIMTSILINAGNFGLPLS